MTIFIQWNAACPLQTWISLHQCDCMLITIALHKWFLCMPTSEIIRFFHVEHQIAIANCFLFFRLNNFLKFFQPNSVSWIALINYILTLFAQFGASSFHFFQVVYINLAHILFQQRIIIEKNILYFHHVQMQYMVQSLRLKCCIFQIQYWQNSENGVDSFYQCVVQSKLDNKRN